MNSALVLGSMEDWEGLEDLFLFNVWLLCIHHCFVHIMLSDSQ